MDLPFVWCPKCDLLTVKAIKYYTDDGNVFCTRRYCENEEICTHLKKEIDEHGRNKTL